MLIPEMHPISRTRQFVKDHQFAITSVVAVAAFGAGCRLTANQYQDFLCELDPTGALIDQFFDTGEV